MRRTLLLTVFIVICINLMACSTKEDDEILVSQISFNNETTHEETTSTESVISPCETSDSQGDSMTTAPIVIENPELQYSGIHISEDSIDFNYYDNLIVGCYSYAGLNININADYYAPLSDTVSVYTASVVDFNYDRLCLENLNNNSPVCASLVDDYPDDLYLDFGEALELSLELLDKSAITDRSDLSSLVNGNEIPLYSELVEQFTEIEWAPVLYHQYVDNLFYSGDYFELRPAINGIPIRIGSPCNSWHNPIYQNYLIWSDDFRLYNHDVRIESTNESFMRQYLFDNNSYLKLPPFAYIQQDELTEDESIIPIENCMTNVIREIIASYGSQADSEFSYYVNVYSIELQYIRGDLIGENGVTGEYVLVPVWAINFVHYITNVNSNFEASVVFINAVTGEPLTGVSHEYDPNWGMNG